MRSNAQIRISPIRLIGQNDEQIGIVETEKAIGLAREAGLDLVEVAPSARPPVCRIMDFGKWKYRQKKHHKKHHEQQLKEVRIRPKTDSHDRAVKLKRAIRFLRKGDKVQFTMMFRGRERAHREIGITIFRRIIAEFGEQVKVERPPSMDGRHMIMILAPIKGAFEDAEPDGKTEGPDKREKPKKTTPRPAPEEKPPAEPDIVMEAEQVPAVQASTEQAPAEQTPGEQTPGEQAPAEQAPAEQAPAEQAPAEQPAEET